MEENNAISNLRLQMRSKKKVIAVTAVALLVIGTCAHFRSTKSFILVDGKPVVCVSTAKDASDVIHKIKSDTSRNISEVQFKQDVVIARAPGAARPISRYKAARVLQKVVCPVFPRWAIIVNGKPAVAIPSREMAGEVLDHAKMKFGMMAKNLLEEPQFKENVTVDIAAVEPSIYCKSVDQAVNFLFAETAPVMKDSDYTVKQGDLAGSIAHRYGLNLNELAAINPGFDLDKLQIGDKLHVRAAEAQKPRITVVVRDVSDRIITIPAQLQRISSAALFVGKTFELSSGKPGQKRVKMATIYENGRKVSSEVMDEEIIREAIPHRVAVGIKPVPTWK